MHICHLTSAHPPFDTRIFHKEAKSLLKAGHEVTLVAQHDKDETVEGIKILSLPKSRNRIERMTRIVWQVYRKALKIDADIYHFHDPELMLIGLLLKLRGKRVIYDVHEDMPAQIKIKDWISPIFRTAVSATYNRFENISVKIFDAILVPQVSMQKRFLHLNENAVLVANYVKNDFYISESYELKRTHILYAGSLAPERGLINMLNAIEFVKENHMLYLAGEFANLSIKRRAQHHRGWKRVKYFGFLDQPQVSLLHKKCLIGVILYEHIGQYHMANSLKLFEYMLSEMPIIMPDFGDWPAFNEENQCGICVDVRDSKRIGAAINSLFHNPDEAERLGKNGKKAVEKKYNWIVSENNLINIYRKILN